MPVEREEGGHRPEGKEGGRVEEEEEVKLTGGACWINHIETGSTDLVWLISIRSTK